MRFCKPPLGTVKSTTASLDECPFTKTVRIVALTIKLYVYVVKLRSNANPVSPL